MGVKAKMAWMMTIALCVADTSLPLLLALPLDSLAVSEGSSNNRTKQQVIASTKHDLGSNDIFTEGTEVRQEKLIYKRDGSSISRQTAVENTTDDKKQYIRLLQSWNIEPSLYPKSATTNKEDAKVMVLPLAFLLAFLIGLAIKATHWWNEDIRYADGLMVNVYSPHKTHPKVLMKVYSTERADPLGTSARIDPDSSHPGSGTPPREPLKTLPHASSRGYLLDEYADEDEVFDMSKRSKLRMQTSFSSRPGKIRSSSVETRSPTESLCSRCRQMDIVGSQLQIGEKEASSRYYDEHILELCKLATVSSSLAMRRLQRQCSTRSTHSVCTMRSESRKDGAPQPILKGNRSCGKLSRQSTVTERSRIAPPKVHVDNGRRTTPYKVAVQQRKVDSLTQRTASESQLGGLFKGNAERTLCDECDLLGIDALLKNSILLNLDILNSLNASRGRTRFARPSDGAAPYGRQRGAELASDPASPNQTSRGSSSYLSSSDITSSNTTSTRTSATALISSHSSVGSLCANPSRKQAKRQNLCLNDKPNLPYENNPKAFSVPSLKVSNKPSSAPSHGEKSKVYFTIGSQKITADSRGSGIRRTLSSAGEAEWDHASGGQQNLALCRSVSFNSSLDCKQASVRDGLDASRTGVSSRSNDDLIP